MNKTKRKNTKGRKNKTKRNNMKGGFINNMSFSLFGFKFGKKTGQQVYENGEWRDQPCYNFFGYEICK